VGKAAVASGDGPPLSPDWTGPPHRRAESPRGGVPGREPVAGLLLGVRVPDPLAAALRLKCCGFRKGTARETLPEVLDPRREVGQRAPGVAHPTSPALEVSFRRPEGASDRRRGGLRTMMTGSRPRRGGHSVQDRGDSRTFRHADRGHHRVEARWRAGSSVGSDGWEEMTSGGIDPSREGVVGFILSMGAILLTACGGGHDTPSSASVPPSPQSVERSRVR